jgi:3-deoxy-7-phosphoheptulonate synthase
MVVVMQEGATEEQIQSVIDRLIQKGFDVHRSSGATHTVLGAVGGAPIDPADVEVLEGVREVVKISAPYKLANRSFKPDGSIVKVGPKDNSVAIGGREIVMMAGPCTVESAEQVNAIAPIMKDCGGTGVPRSQGFRT